MDLTVVLMILAAALYLGAITFAIVQIARTADLNAVEKAVWIAAVVWVPLIGSIVWFAAGPHPLGLRLGGPDRR